MAQLIDGTLGMAYGVSLTTLLLSLGISPSVASASVHTSELCTTGLSGFCHWRLGNVDPYILKRLLLPGVVGGIFGAYILTAVPGDVIKPFVSLYLLGMGILILVKAFRALQPAPQTQNLAPLGLIGGFVDAVGGGGWGPVVTSSLVANGNDPRFAIGSVNTAEFFVTAATSFTFLLTMKMVHWEIIFALMLGGVIAAPIAAFACRRIQPKPLMVAVGILIIGLSLRSILLLNSHPAGYSLALTGLHLK